jgi:hypothetical protein
VRQRHLNHFVWKIRLLGRPVAKSRAEAVHGGARAITDKVEAAYRRGDLFEKRRKLMEHWDRYLSKPRLRESYNVIGYRSQVRRAP